MGQSNLPLASGEKHVKAFVRCGWTVARRAKNAHIVLTKPGCAHVVSIPDHVQVKRALLQKQLKRAGITEDEYRAAFAGRGHPSP